MLRHRNPTRRTLDLRHRRAAASLLAATAAYAMVVGGLASASRHAAITPTQVAEPWQSDSLAAPPGRMYETFAPDGSISLQQGSPYVAPPPLPIARVRGIAGVRSDAGPTVTPMHQNGASDNRIDLVFIGDGYTADEQGAFDASAERAWKALMNYEPYKTYQNFFNASRINIASPVSGISNDPENGLTRSTPLGMHFWCHNIERLLCVNTSAASSYAALFPGVSHVVAIAHTTTYGGAGGGTTTLAGENSDSSNVIVHEMAHTIAGLGDEYQSSYSAADGGAGSSENTSNRVADLMIKDKWKWYKWIGKPSADGSTVGAYEGSNYYDKGYYRPSLDSEMRTLGKPFNPPSIEALIRSFYKSRNREAPIDPIDSVTPAPNQYGVTDLSTTLSASLIPLVGRSYQVYWGVNGVSVPGSLGKTSLNLAAAPLTKGKWNQVSIYVVDDNPAVMDDDFRRANMSKTTLWWVWGG